MDKLKKTLIVCSTLGACINGAFWFGLPAAGVFSAEPGPKTGEILHGTMVCSKLDDLKHARSLGEAPNFVATMAAFNYALNHDCTVLNEGMRVKVDKEIDGFACVRTDLSETCRWTVIQNVAIPRSAPSRTPLQNRPRQRGMRIQPHHLPLEDVEEVRQPGTVVLRLVGELG
jgi:hypothetical protein